MVKLIGLPVVQFVTVGVTVIVEVKGVDPLFVPLKEAIFPVPLAARPMAVLLFVQWYTVPAIAPEKVIAFVFVFLHIV